MLALLQPTAPIASRCISLVFQPSLRRWASDLVPRLRDPSLLKTNVCYVNGQWIPAGSGNTVDVSGKQKVSMSLLYFFSHLTSAYADPATGKLIGSSPDFAAVDTEAAIAAASHALAEFRYETGRSRAKMLRQWHGLIVKNAQDLATLITWENGKPVADAKGEVAYAASFLEWFAEEAPPMITRKVGPALAAGCTVVVKVPSEAPYTGLAIAELGHRAGIPKGVINVITSHQNTAEVGKTLTTSPAVRKISFTGSTDVGKTLMGQSASTLKKMSMELGGNAPFIVFDDADLDAAVSGAIACKFRSSGQTCVCANRILVQASIYDEFSDRLVAAVARFKVGNGFEPTTTHGPLIHERAVQKVEAHVQDAQAKGARLLFGGRRLPSTGSAFFEPTVLADMTPDMAIATEETFGPVAGLFPFQTEADAVKLANAVNVGLAGYFFSRNIERIYRMVEHIDVGMVGVNTGIISDAASPFGGVKESGFGREGSSEGISEYQVTNTVTFGQLQRKASKDTGKNKRNKASSDGILSISAFDRPINNRRIPARSNRNPSSRTQSAMSRNLLRPAYGLTRAEFHNQLSVRSRALSTTTSCLDDTSRSSPPHKTSSTSASRLPRSRVAASEISSMLRHEASQPPPGANQAGPGTAGNPRSGPPLGTRVVNVRSLPRGRGGLRLGGGALGTVVRNPDGTVSVRRMAKPTAGGRSDDPRRQQNGRNSEGIFRSRGGARTGRGRGGMGSGGRGGKADAGGRAGQPGQSRDKRPVNQYHAMAEDIDWYAPYTKEELQVLAERVPAAPTRVAETFVPELGIDELLEYAPALATDSNVLGKAATVRQTLKTIAGGPVDPGHLAHPNMMAAKYDYRGVMYFEKLQTKELLEQRANISIKMGPDDRLKDVLVRRTLKGQYEPIPAVPKSDVLQLTRNYHLKANTYHSTATDKFQVKLEEILAKAKPKQPARST
ncbi:Glutarate-semialdehyde dehydrogenase DavD [Ceratocystis lukuohia]|uniref:Succinate-semialdehyde dehydrogenase, mitochondrial n=1 Tax=Ceratocystis lukuohia TaxID=2019550 RepID=A0ABR4MBI4_9PEZI